MDINIEKHHSEWRGSLKWKTGLIFLIAFTEQGIFSALSLFFYKGTQCTGYPVSAFQIKGKKSKKESVTSVLYVRNLLTMLLLLQVLQVVVTEG